MSTSGPDFCPPSQLKKTGFHFKPRRKSSSKWSADDNSPTKTENDFGQSYKSCGDLPTNKTSPKLPTVLAKPDKTQAIVSNSMVESVYDNMPENGGCENDLSKTVDIEENQQNIVKNNDLTSELNGSDKEKQVRKIFTGCTGLTESTESSMESWTLNQKDENLAPANVITKEIER